MCDWRSFDLALPKSCRRNVMPLDTRDGTFLCLSGLTVNPCHKGINLTVLILFNAFIMLRV